MKLAEALQSFAPLDELQAHVDSFDAKFQQVYLEIMRKKVGFLSSVDISISRFFLRMFHQLLLSKTRNVD